MELFLAILLFFTKKIQVNTLKFLNVLMLKYFNSCVPYEKDGALDHGIKFTNQKLCLWLHPL